MKSNTNISFSHVTITSLHGKKEHRQQGHWGSKIKSFYNNFQK